MLQELQNRIFFIIGVGRSGTSLLQEILNCFNNFCNVEESKSFEGNELSLWMPVRESGNFMPLEKFIQDRWTSQYFVEKTPDSILCLEQLSYKYPHSNYIFLQRHPEKIVLSLLNLFSESYDIKERFYHIENKIMLADDLALNREQYYAKMVLNQVENQIKFKKSFQNSIIIKYEDLISEPGGIIEMLEKKFGIKANKNAIHDVLGRPSYSSKSTHHDKKEIKDEFAKAMIKKASELWEYQYDSKLKEDYNKLSKFPNSYLHEHYDVLLQWSTELQNEIKNLIEQKIQYKSLLDQNKQLQETVNHYNKIISDIQNSKTWKILQILRIYRMLPKISAKTKKQINKAYHELLNREVDEMGLSRYGCLLETKQMTLGEIYSEIKNSPEYEITQNELLDKNGIAHKKPEHE